MTAGKRNALELTIYTISDLALPTCYYIQVLLQYWEQLTLKNSSLRFLQCSNGAKGYFSSNIKLSKILRSLTLRNTASLTKAIFVTEHANAVVITMTTFYILFTMSLTKFLHYIMNANISQTFKLQLPTHIT
jgi:hypothetical protein